MNIVDKQGTVICLVQDLALRTKIRSVVEELGRPFVFARSAEDVENGVIADPSAKVIIDLHHQKIDPLEVIRQCTTLHPSIEVLGFYSHVDPDAAYRASSAGTISVFPRSKFFSELLALVS